MELVNEAIAFAAKAHDGMRRRKSDVPYIVHPMEVAVTVGTMTDDHSVIAAAMLHDVVEDAGISIDEIGERFGERVKYLVASESENKREELPPEQTWYIRKRESLEKLRDSDDIGVKMLWLADKLSNIRAIYSDWEQNGDAVWESFHQKDPGVQAWYYRTVVELTERLSHTAAWREYKTLVERIFG